MAVRNAFLAVKVVWIFGSGLKLHSRTRHALKSHQLCFSRFRFPIIAFDHYNLRASILKARQTCLCHFKYFQLLYPASMVLTWNSTWEMFFFFNIITFILHVFQFLCPVTIIFFQAWKASSFAFFLLYVFRLFCPTVIILSTCVPRIREMSTLFLLF